MDRKHFISMAGKSLLGGAVILSSCSDLLDQNNPNQLTPDQFWKSAGDAEKGVNAVYQIFHGQPGSNNVYTVNISNIYRSDIVGLTHDRPGRWAFSIFLPTASNTLVNSMWNLYYQGIFRANQAIQNIPNISSIDSSLQKRYIGEAKFLRAYWYFLIVINYKNAPIILKGLRSKENYSEELSPPDKIWAQIEKDLKDAKNVLPVAYDASNKGRITKGAALAYLGKSYLYQQKWSDAVSAFDQVINSGDYGLVPEFKDVFGINNEFNEETILEVNYSSQNKKGQTVYTTRNYEEAIPEAGGWYGYWPNQWLFDQMKQEKTKDEKLDPRLYHTILFNGSEMKYYGQSYAKLIGADEDKMGFMKYSEAELNHTIQEESGKNWRVLRYADVLLMHAEAVLRSGGTLADAKTSINKVRNRATLENLPASMSKEEVLHEIEHQRICELAGEGIRWYDLVRWDGNINRTMSIKEILEAHGATGADNFQPKNKYLPIPLEELQSNNKAEQNPEYT